MLIAFKAVIMMKKMFIYEKHLVYSQIIHMICFQDIYRPVCCEKCNDLNNEKNIKRFKNKAPNNQS